MRTRGWGVALLGLLAAAAVASAQPPKSKAMPEGWWRDLFGPSKPKDEPIKPDAKPTPPMPDQSAELTRLQKALDRRQEVCLKLIEIAQATNDPALEAEAQRLDQLAFRIYQEQSARLQGGRARMPEADEPEPLRIRSSPPARPNQARPGTLDPSRLGEGE